MNRQEPRRSDQRIVITGVGVASSIGHTSQTYWHQLFSGAYGIRPLEGVDQTFLKHGIGGQITDFPEPDWKARLDEKNSSQLTAITLYCAQQAVQESRLVFDEDQSDRYGAVIGSGFHNLYDLEAVYRDYFRHSKKLGTMTIPRNMSSAPASRIAMYYGLHGHISTVSSACSSGFTALSNAVDLIRSGRHDVVISGGTDLMISETQLLSWERMRVLSRTDDPKSACRPFSKGREGIAIGDGCALFVLESLAHAEQRGAPILAEISGIFQNSDSLDLVKPNATGEISCMRAALDDAAIEPDRIDIIFAHATGTELNDQVEYEAMEAVFGESLPEIPVCALKSMTGHTMGASGPMALAAGIGSISCGYVYPVPNLDDPDPDIPLTVYRQGHKQENVNHILLNTFAFGGINVSIIISRWGIS